MGYPRHGGLNDNKHTLIEPMIHTNGHRSRDTTSLGYGVDDSLPIYDEQPPTASNSKDEIQPIASTIP